MINPSTGVIHIFNKARLITVIISLRCSLSVLYDQLICRADKKGTT